MKIKNFMKETDKKLKKHSYNAQSIMEAVLGREAIAYEYTKNRSEFIPDTFIWERDSDTIYKKISRHTCAPQILFSQNNYNKIEEGDLILEVYPFENKIYKLFSKSLTKYKLMYYYFDENGEFKGFRFVERPVDSLKSNYSIGLACVYRKSEQKYVLPKKTGEELDESVTEHGESVYNYTIKEKNNIPDYFYNEHTDEYIFKKQYPKDNADDDFDDIKNGDILLIDFELYGRLPLWIHKIYEAFSGTMVTLRHYSFIHSNDGKIDFDGENELKYQLETLKYLNRKGKIIFYKKESPTYDIGNDGSDFDEPLNESIKYFKQDRNTLISNLDRNVVYTWLPIYEESDEEIYNNLKQVQSGDVIYMQINGKKDYYELNSPILENRFVYIDSGNGSAYQITSDVIVRMIRNFEVKIFVRNYDYDTDLSNKPLDDGDWDEELNESSVYEDEPGKDGIIEIDGRKYYKVVPSRHIKTTKEMFEYLVPGQTVFVYNQSFDKSKRIFFYKEWQPKKYLGYKLSDEPSDLIMIEKGKEDYALKLEIYSMDGYLKKGVFELYIPEVLAEKTNIKDEWELTSGEEFNECKNLKGKDLEQLKEGTIISGKKKIKILNKKGNYYNVISEGKKYKYDIDDLKYDYTHKKVKICKGK